MSLRNGRNGPDPDRARGAREGAGGPSPEPTLEVVHSYTRAQALADGVLVDVSAEAGGGPGGMLGGFTCPVAVTAAVWAAVRAIPASLAGMADERGRLHEVLWMAACALRSQGPDAPAPVPFRVILPSRGTRKRLRILWVHVGPDDHGGPCVTVGFPEDF